MLLSEEGACSDSVTHHDGASSANPWKQYAYHPQYVDSIALRYYDENTDGAGIVEHYYLQDANFNVTAVTDSAGTVVERYAYTPYGEVTVLDLNFSAVTGYASAISNELLYTGRRLDPETGLQLNRNRFYHAPLGRWVNRDPIGYAGGTLNLYEYVGGMPTVGLDPEGTDCPGCDLPAWVGADGSVCVTNCCFVHDECYHRHGCTSASWIWNFGTAIVGGCAGGVRGAGWGWWLAGAVSDCADCNKEVTECITRCALGNHMGPVARYFCARLGREVTIGAGGNFRTLAAARRACCN